MNPSIPPAGFDNVPRFVAIALSSSPYQFVASLLIPQLSAG